LIFPLQYGCVASPIHGCGFTGSGSEALVIYSLTITELLLDDKYDAFDWLNVLGLASFKNFKICNN